MKQLVITINNIPDVFFDAAWSGPPPEDQRSQNIKIEPTETIEIDFADAALKARQPLVQIMVNAAAIDLMRQNPHLLSLFFTP